MEEKEEFYFKPKKSVQLSSDSDHDDSLEIEVEKTVLAKPIEGELNNEDKFKFLGLILITRNQKLINQILSGDKLIDESMVKVIPEKIQDEIVNFLESFHQLKPFFDEDG